MEPYQGDMRINSDSDIEEWNRKYFFPPIKDLNELILFQASIPDPKLDDRLTNLMVKTPNLGVDKIFPEVVTHKLSCMHNNYFIKNKPQISAKLTT